MNNDKDRDIPWQLIMFRCTALRHALLAWQKNKGVNPKASKSKLKPPRPDCSNYINHNNDSGKITSSCAVTGRRLFTSPFVADTYSFLMNTVYTPPERYHQRVSNNTLATVKTQIQQAENPTPAVAISLEALCADNAILLDFLDSGVTLKEPDIRSPDPNISIDNHSTNEELHFGMPRGSGLYKRQGNQSDDRNASPTGNGLQWAATELERFDLVTRDVGGYEGDDGDDPDRDADEEGE
jgi:hypothetical protein